MSADPILTAERHHLEKSTTALEHMRRSAEAITDGGVDAFASESLGAARSRRLKALADDGTVPPFFGRTDRSDTAETFHIGRRHVRDDQGDPLVIDWRAPMSTTFYRATSADPQGVRLRRRFGFAGPLLTSYEDELLELGGRPGESQILLAEIERPRVGPMRDIVATIQPDQDEIVRAPIEVSICVQGAPGTGKTAVGLHRAAYLLYTYPERLRQAGVLVVGPNRAFLGYIAAVLPALGEGGVEQASIVELTASVPVRAEDTPEVATLKGDARMAEVLRRAVYGGIRKPTDSLAVPLAGRRYRVSEQSLRRCVDDLRRSDVRYSAGRERLALAIAENARRQKEAGGGSPTDAEMRRAARSDEVTAFLAEVWPAVDAPSLIASLLGTPAALARAARGILTDEEQALLRWVRPPRSVASASWSAADTVLVDEVAGLLERTPSYGHIVLDEAQDLSPMQYRAIARRSSTGSITVLGDVAQGTSPWSSTDWLTSLRHLDKPEAVVQPLTRGYRVPGEVLAYANRLLPHLGVSLKAVTSVRHGDHSLAVRSVSRVDGAAVNEADRLLGFEGSVGVICSDASVARLTAGLARAGLDPQVLTDEAAGPRLSVVPASLAKGLEFDSVLVVEPADIVAAEPRGLNRLYVVLTRAVSRLVVVHAEPLPAELQ
ncbi:MAG: AAA family ATPase [Actinomycetota bacterium]|nr:AAA family ATPase [Actinomycetota bacterium]